MRDPTAEDVDRGACGRSHDPGSVSCLTGASTPRDGRHTAFGPGSLPVSVGATKEGECRCHVIESSL